MDIQNINLIKAAKIGDLQVIKKIIKNGGNVNYICDDITALIWAAQNGHLDVEWQHFLGLFFGRHLFLIFDRS
ncbi:MAG: hypothetical protein H9Q65_04095 [Spiroplasma ixodetis]|nr:hypothetical protein [Spiroplasma ixodetis]MBP1527220.1 hypothetical protein [Spiroplasma ixodetis]MBP1528407.1 hypothetical protein [Spiroplasma ixodetis]